MNKLWPWLRSWLAPLALVGLAMVLTVPWSYLVILAAYERDISENARSLAISKAGFESKGSPDSNIAE